MSKDMSLINVDVDNEILKVATEILNNITWIQKEKKELLLGFIEYLRTRNK